MRLFRRLAIDVPGELLATQLLASCETTGVGAPNRGVPTTPLNTI